MQGVFRAWCEVAVVDCIDERRVWRGVERVVSVRFIRGGRADSRLRVDDVVQLDHDLVAVHGKGQADEVLLGVGAAGQLDELVGAVGQGAFRVACRGALARLVLGEPRPRMRVELALVHRVVALPVDAHRVVVGVRPV